jgi:hypothetical protein
MTNLHKRYTAIIAAIVVAGLLILASQWRDKVRDDALRDGVIKTQKTEIEATEQKIAMSQAVTKAVIDNLEKQIRIVAQQPQQAPDIIRDQIHTSTPIVQTAPLTKDTLPDAPVAQLTKQNEIDLAQYALSCRECGVARDQLAGEVKDQQDVIARQKTELAAAVKAAKGGSVWQRSVRVVKWAAPIGFAAYVIGRTQR